MKRPGDGNLFWCLLAVQFAGTQMILWGGLPIYHRLLAPGGHGASAWEVAIGFGAVIVMQAAHWPAERLRQTLRFQRNVFFGHILIWLGELSIFFTAALCAIIVFNRVGEGPLALWRLFGLAAVTFAVSAYKFQIMSVGGALIEGDRGAERALDRAPGEASHLSSAPTPPATPAKP
jgi:hypothetical protein